MAHYCRQIDMLTQPILLALTPALTLIPILTATLTLTLAPVDYPDDNPNDHHGGGVEDRMGWFLVGLRLEGAVELYGSNLVGSGSGSAPYCGLKGGVGAT